MKYETDVTLIDMMLAMTPRERVRWNDRVLRVLEELRVLELEERQRRTLESEGT